MRGAVAGTSGGAAAAAAFLLGERIRSCLDLAPLGLECVVGDVGGVGVQARVALGLDVEVGRRSRVDAVSGLQRLQIGPDRVGDRDQPVGDIEVVPGDRMPAQIWVDELVDRRLLTGCDVDVVGEPEVLGQTDQYGTPVRQQVDVGDECPGRAARYRARSPVSC